MNVCGGTFEANDPLLMQELLSEFPSAQARAEAFLQGFHALAEALLSQLKELRRRMSEAADPLLMLCCAAERCQHPVDSPEKVVADAFHIAPKAERRAALPAVHFACAAWRREPRGALQWHHIGQYLGTVCG